MKLNISGKKKWVFVGGLVVVILFVIFLFQQPQTDTAVENITASPTQVVNQTIIQEDPQTQQQVLEVVDTVVGHIRIGDFTQATQYFLYRPDTRQTSQGVLDVLASDRALFSENGIYQADIEEGSVEVVGSKAQVLVSHNVGGKQSISRYDLENTAEGWKIAEIVYNLQNDLAETDRLRKLYLASVAAAKYSENPTSYELPGGGSITLKKSLFTSLRTERGTHVDIELQAVSPQRNYRVGFYNGSSFAFVVSIRKGEPGTHFHAIDIRPAIESGGGVLYFYPDTTQIITGVVGAPLGGAVLSIPLKLQLQ